MKKLLVVVACILMSLPMFGAEPGGYSVRYSGGSGSAFTNHSYLRMFVETDKIRIIRLKDTVTIPTAQVTEVNTSTEENRRVGKAAMLSLLSPGAGMIMAFTKAKGYYIGIVWDDAGTQNGIVVQAGKKDFATLLAAVESATGKKALNPINPVQATREMKGASAPKK